MNKQTIITALLALVAMTGQAQPQKTAIVKGYSPALEDSTVVNIYVDNVSVASDTVFGGRFMLSVPVEKLTKSSLFLWGKGCPNYLSTLFLSPGVTVSLTGTDCLHPLWKVDSPVPEQQTINRIMEHNSDAIREYLLIDLDDASWNKMLPVQMKILKQTMDILPSLPVDAASLTKLEGVARMAKNMNDFPYMQQLKELEASTAARAPKGFEKELAMIHAFVYPAHVQQVGEEFVDAELKDFMAAADVVVSRSGSNAIFELWSLKKPMLLVPLPSTASRGEQSLNAQAFKNQGFAEVIKDEDLEKPNLLLEGIDSVYENRGEMCEKMENSELKYTNASELFREIVNG